jgi:hypothetical protein
VREYCIASNRACYSSFDSLSVKLFQREKDTCARKPTSTVNCAIASAYGRHKRARSGVWRVVLDESLRIVKQQITRFANTAPRMPVPLLCSFPPILIVFVVLRYSLFFNGFQRFRCQIYCQFGETEMAGILSSTIRYQACWLPLFTTKLRYGFFPLLESLRCFRTASSTPSCGLLRTFRTVFLVHFCFTLFTGFQRLNCLFNCQFEGSAWACMLSSAHLVAPSAVKSGGCLSSTTRLHQAHPGKTTYLSTHAFLVFG